MTAMADHPAWNPPRGRSGEARQATPAEAAATPTSRADAQLTRLHELHSKQLLNYLVKLTLGDRKLAEDLLQETFVRAWRHLSRHGDTDIDTFRPWLYTVARRLVVDMLRSRRSRPSEVVMDDLTKLSVSEDTIADVVSARAVREALLRLRPDQRGVLIELYFHGRTPSEVAARLGVPVGTVKSRAHYAKQALRTYLNQ
ncbi:sigma-70 family RNA polymerase sigma factor [Micromonospora sp. RP3T]|uniref:sigma-70 family RNA polymerase sigma factor n=1 Tax=Micromonospora sp. RP3T TaxID=2135446 RepID=UPI0013049789|nr:sigma-70 family RNA polymerase sigma factor [Micromonospora sp. RP3T]